MSFRYMSHRKQFSSRLLRLLPALLIFGCGLLPQKAESADQFRAFYYDANGVLLQVELVDQQKMAQRTLEDIDATTLVIPMLTSMSVPKITGTNKPMSRLATIAVYYKASDDNTPNVQAKPFKVEDLRVVQERTIETCLPRASNDPCPYPKRCHCVTGTCCCY